MVMLNIAAYGGVYQTPIHPTRLAHFPYPRCEAAEAEKRLLWLDPIMDKLHIHHQSNDKVVFLNMLKASSALLNLSFLIWIRSLKTSY